MDLLEPDLFVQKTNASVQTALYWSGPFKVFPADVLSSTESLLAALKLSEKHFSRVK